MKVQFGIFLRTESGQLWPYSGKNCGLVKMTPSIQNRISKNVRLVYFKIENIKKKVAGHHPHHPNQIPYHVMLIMEGWATTLDPSPHPTEWLQQPTNGVGSLKTS